MDYEVTRVSWKEGEEDQAIRLPNYTVKKVLEEVSGFPQRMYPYVKDDNGVSYKRKMVDEDTTFHIAYYDDGLGRYVTHEEIEELL